MSKHPPLSQMDEIKKEIAQVYLTENAQEKKFAPVSSSYLRENLYQPLTKKFTLAWENIYKQLYEPNTNDSFKKRRDANDPPIPFTSIDSAIKPLQVLEIYNKGLNSNIPEGDEVYMNSITYLPPEKKEEERKIGRAASVTKFKKEVQSTVKNTTKKPTFILDPTRELLLESVGILFDKDKDKFISKSKRDFMISHRESRLNLPTNSNLTFKTNNRTSQSKSKRTNNISSCPTTRRFNNLHFKEGFQSVVLYNQVPSDALFQKQSNVSNASKEVPGNNASTNENFSTPKSVIGTQRKKQAAYTAVPMTARNLHTAHIEQFLEEVNETSKFGKRCMTSCMKNKRRLTKEFNNADEIIKGKDTEFSRKDKRAMLKEYSKEKCAFLYGKNGAGHFLTEEGVNYIKKSDLISKINPTYKFLIANIHL
jgi:hypothetical protein